MNQEMIDYANFLKSKYSIWIGPRYYEPKNNSLQVEFVEGSKFIKVLTTNYGITSVHSFIVKKNGIKTFKVGDILKAASYNAPAQNFVRGNILTKDYGKITWAGAW